MTFAEERSFWTPERLAYQWRRTVRIIRLECAVRDAIKALDEGSFRFDLPPADHEALEKIVANLRAALAATP